MASRSSTFFQDNHHSSSFLIKDNGNPALPSASASQKEDTQHQSCTVKEQMVNSPETVPTHVHYRCEVPAGRLLPSPVPRKQAETQALGVPDPPGYGAQPFNQRGDGRLHSVQPRRSLSRGPWLPAATLTISRSRCSRRRRRRTHQSNN